jgi:hypothetical protein
MFEFIDGIHKAPRIESTWAFVLVVAIGFACVGGVVAWVVDTGYRNSQEYKQAHPSASNPGGFGNSSGTVPIQQAPPTSEAGPQKTSTSKKTIKPKSSEVNQTPAISAPQTIPRVVTPEEQQQIIRTLIQKYEAEHPGPVQTSTLDEMEWINKQLKAQGMPFHLAPRPTVLDNVNIQGFGSTQLSNEGTVIMKGGSVTDGEVGVENNGGQIILDGTQVTRNEKNIVNNAEPKKKEPAEIKPPPQP